MLRWERRQQRRSSLWWRERVLTGYLRAGNLAFSLFLLRDRSHKDELLFSSTRHALPSPFRRLDRNSGNSAPLMFRLRGKSKAGCSATGSRSVDMRKATEPGRRSTTICRGRNGLAVVAAKFSSCSRHDQRSDRFLWNRGG